MKIRNFMRHLSFCCLISVMAVMALPAAATETLDIRGQAPSFPDSARDFGRIYDELFDAVTTAIPEYRISKTYNNPRRAKRDVAAGLADFYFPIPCIGAEFTGENVNWGQERLGYVAFGVFSHASNPVTRAHLLQAKYRLSHAQLNELDGVFSDQERRQLKTLATQQWSRRHEMLEAVHRAIGRKLNQSENLSVSRAAFPYIVDTEMADLSFIAIPAHPGSSPQNSVKKLVRKRIDAYVFPVLPVEKAIQSLDANDQITRDFYEAREVCFIVAQSKRGREIDSIISEAFRRVKENGDYKRIFGANDKAERDWVMQYGKVEGF